MFKKDFLRHHFKMNVFQWLAEALIIFKSVNWLSSKKSTISYEESIIKSGSSTVKFMLNLNLSYINNISPHLADSSTDWNSLLWILSHLFSHPLCKD